MAQTMDLVSRQQVIDALNELAAGGGVTGPDDMIDVDYAIDAVKRLNKFVRKQGVWQFCYVTNKRGDPSKRVWCNRCKTVLFHSSLPSNYCPICGAQMAKERVLVPGGLPRK